MTLLTRGTFCAPSHPPGEIQTVKFWLQDVDGHMKDKDHTVKGDSLGEATTTLDEIVAKGSTRHGLPLSLTGDGKKDGATLMVYCEDVSPKERGTLSLTLKGEGLKNHQTLMRTSDPFWVLEKVRPDSVCIPVARSGVKKSNLNPVWETVEIDLQHLCNGDTKRELKLTVFDHQKDDVFVDMGYQDIGMTLDSIMNPGAMFALKGPPGSKTSRGHVTVLSSVLKKVPTFEAYVENGLQIHLAVAIDFTGSNGAPSSPKSLHYVSPSAQSPYQQAMGAVAAVLAPFDHDQKIQLYGFGASPKKGAGVSHCFPLNGNLSDPSCDGVDGLNKQYLESVKTVDFSGPTNAAPVITKVMADAKSRASAVSGPLSYTVLLVLTDGELTDMADTVTACKDAANLPMSIMFVGIGNETFDAMNPLRSGVQSTSFLRMEDYGAGAAARLRAKVLADLPGQVEHYFVGKGIAVKR